MATKKIAAAVLSLALLAPADAAFARTHRIHHRSVQSYTSVRQPRYSHYYSRTRGTAIGAVAGALIDHRHPLTGAIIGGTLGNAVQYERSHRKRH